ncbi:calcitonin gene-related peptide type 1 receptor-like [Cetorhinus maximus]
MSEMMRGSVVVCIFMALMLTESARELQATQQPAGYMTETNPPLRGLSRVRIMSAQYECYLKIIRDPPYEKEGPYCNRTWDGWLCWDDAPAKSMVMQQCPDYFQDFDHSEKATKICAENGLWFRHPQSNRTWTNYTQCTAYTREKHKVRDSPEPWGSLTRDSKLYPFIPHGRTPLAQGARCLLWWQLIAVPISTNCKKCWAILSRIHLSPVDHFSKKL